MPLTAAPDLDVNALMSDIRNASPAPKPPPHINRGNGSGAARKGGPAAQESFNQQTISVLRGLAAVSEQHEQGLARLQQHAARHEQRLQAQDELLRRHLERPAPAYLGRGQLLVQTARGLPLVCPADDLNITFSLIRDGVWDAPLTQIFERFLKPDMAYLEIGTHIGYFTTLAASLVGHRGKIHAFEANPAVFKLLEKNMCLNHCAYLARLLPQAVSDRTGTTTFHVFASNTGNSTLAALPDKLLEEWRERPVPMEVPCTRLDDFYADHALQFDFLKLDAEGAEPLIFDGGKDFLQRCLKPAAIIALEYNPPAIRGLNREPRAFAEALLAGGLRLWRIAGEDNLEPVSSPEQLDEWCISELLATRCATLPAF